MTAINMKRAVEVLKASATPAVAAPAQPVEPSGITTPDQPQSRSFDALQPVFRWLHGYHGQLRALAIAALALALLVAAWHVLTVNRVSFHVRFSNVPSPGMVLESARQAAASGSLADHIYISCRRIFLGFAIATLIAVPLGLIMGRYRLLREFVFPIAEVVRPIPAIAWVPMSIMLWPTNEESIVFITYLGSFFPILLNTLHGMSNVDPVLVRAARSLGASERAIFREVYFPATLPQIFTGLTIGMGVAWVSLIAAEMISGQFGIGYFTWEAYSLVQYADIVLGMITIGVLGLASSTAVRLIGWLAMPWIR